MKPNIRLSLAFELAPNAVTFSFLAALKKRRRGENIDSDIKDGWGLDKLNSFEGCPSAGEAEGRSLWGMSGRSVHSWNFKEKFIYSILLKNVTGLAHLK